MKKHNWFLARCLVALFSVFFATSIAAPVRAAEPDLLFGETHDYSVVMRGNGESIVYARISLTNNGDATLNDYSFEVPKLDVAEMVGYQIERTATCSLYDYDSTTVPSSRQRPCLKYQEPDYTSSYYSDSDTEYHKLKFTHDGNFYKVSLPNPVGPEKSTGLVISYTGKGYITETLGLFKFNFETLKISKRIKQATVAVDVDSDLVMEGKRAKVNYQTGPTTAAVNSGAELSLSNKSALDSVVSSIGSYGAIIKDAKNLAAGETLSVRGKYAASAWRLNLNKIVISVLALAALIVVPIILVRKLHRRKPKVAAKPAAKAKNPVMSDRLLQPLTLLAGMASAIVVAAGSVLFSFVVKASPGDPDPLSTIIIGVIVLLFYLLAIFGAAVWFAVNRRSWKIFLYIIFWEFAWLIVFAAVYQFGLKDIFGQSDPSDVYPVNTLEMRTD